MRFWKSARRFRGALVVLSFSVLLSGCWAARLAGPNVASLVPNESGTAIVVGLSLNPHRLPGAKSYHYKKHYEAVAIISSSVDRRLDPGQHIRIDMGKKMGVAYELRYVEPGEYTMYGVDTLNGKYTTTYSRTTRTSPFTFKINEGEVAYIGDYEFNLSRNPVKIGSSDQFYAAKSRITIEHPELAAKLVNKFASR